MSTDLNAKEPVQGDLWKSLIKDGHRRSFGYHLPGISYELASILMKTEIPAFAFEWKCAHCNCISKITKNNKLMLRLIPEFCTYNILNTPIQQLIDNALTLREIHDCRFCKLVK